MNTSECYAVLLAEIFNQSRKTVFRLKISGFLTNKL